MVSFILFLSTIAVFPHSFMLLAIVYIVVKNFNDIIHTKLTLKVNVSLVIISAIVVFSLINALLISKTLTLSLLVPYVILMFGSYFIAKYFTLNDVKVLILLILLEVLVGVLEYWLDINTILVWSDFYEEYKNTDLMYFDKAYGLSVNSSVLAVKITLAILLLEYFTPFNNKIRLVIRLVLIFGLYITFQRTSIIVVVLLYIMLLLKYIIVQIRMSIIKTTTRKLIIRGITTIIALVIVFSVILSYSHSIFRQFSQGKEKIELSGREEIWPEYINYIKANIIFGNHSQKYFIKYRGEENGAHAHNSFLQVFATHGLLIFLLFILLIIVNINKDNYIFMGILIVLSLFQYALFWGISLVDIVFFIFALKRPDSYSLETE